MAPELSVVILSYSQFDQTTGPCLDSLREVDTADLEIIVVDNDSDEATLNRLAAAASKDHRIRLVLNKENRGFAGGNNDGVAHAHAETIVLLNSDTRVLPNSLSLLANLLDDIDAPAVIGPVTNAAGNEQQIYFYQGDVQSILTQGELWSHHAARSFFHTDMLSFFCVAMRKETYDELGGLDESYSPGFYEDADFCFRAVQKGVQLVVLEESFVYHAGSASFAAMPEVTARLLKDNREKFRQIHGNITQEHVREKNLQVLAGYVKEFKQSGGSDSLAFRYLNRLSRAEELIPRNPLKKIRYWLKLQKMIKAGKRLTEGHSVQMV